MKRKIAFILCSIMLVSLCACGDRDTESKQSVSSVATATDISSEHVPKLSADEKEEIYNTAKSFIKEKKYEEAYINLIKIKEEKKAKKLLSSLVYKPGSSYESITANGFTREDNYKYTYDKKGNCTTKTGQSSKYEYKYNKAGHIFEEKENSGIEFVTKYSYEDGKLIKIVKSSLNMFQNEVTEFVYNRTGVLSAKIIGEAEYRYEYDKKGNLAKEIYVTNGVTVRVDEYTYDKENVLTQKKSTVGKVIDVTEYSYNEDGNILKEVTVYGGKNSTRKVNYTYDEMGRLVKMRMAVETTIKGTKVIEKETIETFSDFKIFYIK